MTATVPASEGLERAVIGHALLLNNASHLLAHPVGVLFNPHHQQYATAIRALAGAGMAFDFATATAWLDDNGQRVNDIELSHRNYMDAAAGSATIDTMWVQLTDLHERRRYLHVGLELAEAARAGTPIDGLLDQLARSQVVNEPRGLTAALVDWNDFWNESDEGDWLAEPFLARGRGHVLYAEAKQGKSLMALAVAAALATGRPFLDQPAGEPAEVLYLDYEMTRSDLRQRLRDFGYGPHDDLSRLHYSLLPVIAPLNTAAGARQVVDAAQAHNVELVIIDTTSRAVEGEENRADTIQAYYQHTGIQLKELGIATLRIDHAGKDATQGARGSSAKNDDVDLIWKFKRTLDGAKLTGTHRINWAPGEVLITIDETQGVVDYRIDTRGFSYPEGTKELAAILNTLNIPDDWGRTKVTAELREHGQGRRNELVSAAIRWRKAEQPTYLNSKDLSPGQVFLASPGTGSGTASAKPPTHTVWDNSGTTRDSTSRADGDSGVPLSEGHLAQPHPHTAPTSQLELTE